MRLIPQTIMGRTLAVLLLGLALVGAIMASQLYVARQTMLTNIGGWHVVSRIAGVTQVMNETPADQRQAGLRTYQGPSFRVLWSADSPLPDAHIDWQGRLVREALKEQLGDIPRGSFRIGQTVLQLPRQPGFGEHQGMMDRMHGREGRESSEPRRMMVISLRLQDDTWLSFATPPAPVHGVWSSRIFWPSALSLLLVVAVSVWAVRRATQPLHLFARAAERLGLDFNAPPLNESGPREVKRAAKAFNLMQSRLQTFVQDRTHMLAAISHDLRTPITRLRLRAEFVDDKEQQAKMLADLEEMEAMIAATLAFARDDAMNEAAIDLDLAAMVREHCEDARRAGGNVSCDLPETMPFVGRPMGLKRMIANLVGNAVRYGGNTEVSLSDVDGEVLLTVRDDGPGIPADMLERVFDPFVRVEQSRSRETGGTGLGLVAVKTVAQAHGGTVELRNLEGGGLEARVRLPKA